jgi:hypothetical protein
MNKQEKARNKAKRWRERQREDPQKKEKLKEYERMRYLRKKEMGQIRGVIEMPHTAREKLKKRWRVNKRNQRRKQLVSELRMGLICIYNKQIFRH